MKSKNERSFVADFETTTNPNNCYVWAYAINEVADTTGLETEIKPYKKPSYE